MVAGAEVTTRLTSIFLIFGIFLAAVLSMTSQEDVVQAILDMRSSGRDGDGFAADER